MIDSFIISSKKYSPVCIYFIKIKWLDQFKNFVTLHKHLFIGKNLFENV
jgi:hypothetical protein